MIAFLSLFLHILVSPFKARARLEAEIVLLRHQLNVLAYNLANFLRTLALPKAVAHWSLTSLRRS